MADTPSSNDLRHCKFGHVSYPTILQISTPGHTIELCHYLQGTNCAHHVWKANINNTMYQNLAETKNELIHCDICGPLPSSITNRSLKSPRSLITNAHIPIVLTQKILNPRVSTCTECRFGPPHHKLKSFHLYFSSNFKIFVDSRMILELVRMG